MRFPPCAAFARPPPDAGWQTVRRSISDALLHGGLDDSQHIRDPLSRLAVAEPMVGWISFHRDLVSDRRGYLLAFVVDVHHIVPALAPRLPRADVDARNPQQRRLTDPG